MRSLFPAGLLCLSLAPVLSPAQSVVTRTEMNNISVSARNNPLAVFRTAAARPWDMTHARAALSFNFKERTANGEAWLKLHPTVQAMDSLVLDAKNMALESVQAGGSFRSYSYDGKKLVIYLSRRQSAGDTVEVHIRYTARPYYVPPGSEKLPSDEQGLYFINADRSIPGKPVQIWTQGESEENSVWLPMIDKPNERFTTELSLTVPDSFRTVSNGLMTGSRKESGGARTDTWKIDKPIPAYTVNFAIGSWAVVKDKPWNGREVSYYVDPAYAPYAKGIFRHTPEMLDYFSGVTGVTFPWPKFSQIIVRDFVSGAMENVSAVTFGEFVQQDARQLLDRNYEDIVSHELFHQWFGDYVTAESWSNLTLNESFANYGEQLWRKFFYGQQSADELAWADMRRYVDQTNENDESLVRYHYKDESDLFDRISYEKGGAVLRYIHGLSGDSLFYKAMNLYLTRNALRPAEVADWRKAVEDATGRDWMPFFNQWYFRAGHPRLSIHQEYDDAARQLRLTIRQNSAPDSTFLYELPVRTRVMTAAGSSAMLDWTIRKRKETFTIPYPGGDRPVVVVDAEHWVPGEWSEDGKTMADALVQLQQSPDYVGRRFALNLALRGAKDPTAKEVFRAGLKNDMAPVRAYALELLGRVKDKNYSADLKEDVKALFRKEQKGTILAAAMDLLTAWKVSEIQPELYPHLADSSYYAAGAALNALQEFAPDTAYAIAKKLYGSNVRGELKSAVSEAILVRGNAADLPLFEEEARRVYGQEKIGLAFRLLTYAYYTTDDEAYERSLNTIARMAKGEGIPSYREQISSAVTQMVILAKKEALGKEDKPKAKRFKRRIDRTEEIADALIASEPDPALRARLQKTRDTKVSEEKGEEEED